MDINIIRDLVKKGKISNLYCEKTKRLILPNEHYYYVDFHILSTDCEIDKEVRSISNGQYTCFEDAEWSDEDNFYSVDNNHVEGVILDICIYSLFYKESGELIKLKDKILYSCFH